MADKKSFYLKRVGDTRVLTWPVDVNVPQEGGLVDVQALIVRFQMLTREEEDVLLSQEADEMLGKSKPGLATPLLRAVVKGFVGFREEPDAQDMPDEQAIPLLLGTQYVALALRSAYFDMKAGRARKN